MIKTIIFDFDGTIAQSLEMMLSFFNETAPKYDMKPIKENEIDSLRDKSARELLKQFNVPLWKSVPMAAEIQKMQTKTMGQVKIVPGMAKVFRDLKRQGIKVGIVTSSITKNVELFLTKHKVTEMSFIYSEKNLFGKGKVLKHLIKKKQLNKADTMYVGDEVRDIDAAHEAGIGIISVTWGLNTKGRLQLAKPEYLVEKPVEIVEIAIK